MGWHKGQGPDTRDHSRANYRGVDLWVANNQGQHFCQCGCGGEIRIRPYMHCKTTGIPRFIGFHYLRTREYLIAQTERAKKRTGSNAHNWRGGVTIKQEILRKSKPYVEWRNAIFLRDHYTCQKCGAHSGQGKAVYLHAHHYKIPFQILWEEFVAGKRSKETFFDPDLGVTWCVQCHRKHHFPS